MAGSATRTCRPDGSPARPAAVLGRLAAGRHAMRGRTPRVEIVVLTEQERLEFYGRDPRMPLRVAADGRLLREPLDPQLAELSLAEIDADVMLITDLPAGTSLYTAGSADPVPARASGPDGGPAGAPGQAPAAPVQADATTPAETLSSPWPEEIGDARAVETAYSEEIEVITSFLRRRISVLVICDKLVVEHLGPLITERTGGLIGIRLEVPDEEQDPEAADGAAQSAPAPARPAAGSAQGSQGRPVPDHPAPGPAVRRVRIPSSTRRPAASSNCSTTTRVGSSWPSPTRR